MIDKDPHARRRFQAALLRALNATATVDAAICYVSMYTASGEETAEQALADLRWYMDGGRYDDHQLFIANSYARAALVHVGLIAPDEVTH